MKTDQSPSVMLLYRSDEVLARHRHEHDDEQRIAGTDTVLYTKPFPHHGQVRLWRQGDTHAHSYPTVLEAWTALDTLDQPKPLARQPRTPTRLTP